MNYIVEQLLSELRLLILNLGTNGGLIGPSIYDTAQVLRLAPPTDDPTPALHWLQSQQHPDGGWGDPARPLMRDIPTLATILAIDTYRCGTSDREAVAGGLEFLRRQAQCWPDQPPVDIPIGAEFVLPALVRSAQARNLPISARPYAPLEALGQRRRAKMATVALRPATPPVHSWEGWGVVSDPALLDESGGVGHSPAATAAWLYLSDYQPGGAGLRARARRYLDEAAAATGLDIPGVVPTVWPYDRNEQSVALYALLLSGLLSFEPLRDVVQLQLDSLWRGLRPGGQGISDYFICDGDNTAMILATLATASYMVGPAPLQPYLVPDGPDTVCLTYRHEMQRSYSAVAHAAHALRCMGEDPRALEDYLLRQRSADGRWLNEKWHASWLYLTAHTLCMLVYAGRGDTALESLPALLGHQGADGSWGVTVARAEETAYAIMALLALDRVGMLPEAGQGALCRAADYLLRQRTSAAHDLGACWIAKELYRPTRISAIIERSALLACVIGGYCSFAGEGRPDHMLVPAVGAARRLPIRQGMVRAGMRG